ncbi:CaiB/BaiF CoA-transferase family protein [Paractinoplanes lichenicola]|uniref:CoA transferase n=1 Tax=Paractinoplanes lichenicola TaxID=2802976 RepID=A0ABS1VML9_9ACTN|nr:CoA transferase [Actinoplanes lichenicola]MBL7255971.1 CoA transferase [Actinoplanes lichenicola]
MAFLSGYRILDLTDERGLLAGRILAELGADVVQVEPSTGSTARRRGRGFLWSAYAAGKRGITADLDTTEGQDLVRALAATADVVIESDGPSVQGPRGLDHPDLAAINPRLVYVSITAFGRTGPKAGYHASDLTVWAAGGPLDEHRDGDRPPLRVSLPQAFRHAATDAAAGAQLALLARHHTGRGQLVDVSTQAVLGAATLGHVLAHAVGDHPRDMSAGHTLEVKRVDQSGSGAATDPALKKWPCRDGLIEFHIGIGPASGGFTNAFLRWMADEGAPVERFAALDFRTVPAMIQAGEFSDDDVLELRAAIAAFLGAKTKDEVLEAAMQRRLLCVPIFDTTDVRNSRQLRAREFFRTVGEHTLPGPFAQVSTDAFAEPRPAPRIGEHTAEVTAEWLDPAAPGPAASQQPRRPLEGLRVLDFSWVVAGPVIGRALADFGATVVRVESSVRIETARFMQPFQGGVVSPENSALYSTWNAGKLGMTLDLQSEQGQQIARDLAGWADVVVESFSPGLMARWGLDYATLSADNPDLIMLSTSINGQTGPLSKLAGYGNIGAALSGFQAAVGWPDRGPFGPFGPYTDYLGPRFGICTVLGALEHRRRTGQGSYIDLSQVEAGVWLQAPEIAENAATGTVIARMGNADREHAPHGVYPGRTDPDTGADRFVAVAVTTDDQWQALTGVLGRADLRDDDSLRTAPGRLARRDELDAAIAAWTSTRTVEDAESELQAAGVPAHRSAASRDFCLDPQLIHRGHLVEVAHPLHGTTTVEGPRYLLSDTPGRVDRAAPTFGQHNEQILRDLLGYDQKAIDAIVDAKILK